VPNYETNDFRPTKSLGDNSASNHVEEEEEDDDTSSVDSTISSRTTHFLPTHREDISL